MTPVIFSGLKENFLTFCGVEKSEDWRTLKCLSEGNKDEE